MGRLIPAGTGLRHYQNLLVVNPDPDPVPEEEPEGAASEPESEA